MKTLLLTLSLIFVLFACSSEPPKRVYEEPLEITEINPNRWTALVKQNLFHLAKVYDLRPFLYTKKIHIQSRVIPHSHPVLTLNTRNAEKPHAILATWMHEEFHWWVGMNREGTRKAVRELAKMFPNIPSWGTSTPSMTYTHLIICYLEYRSLVHFLGEKEAKEIITELKDKVKLYPWVYEQVLKNEGALRGVVKRYQLLPAPLA